MIYIRQVEVSLKMLQMIVELVIFYYICIKYIWVNVVKSKKKKVKKKSVKGEFFICLNNQFS